MSIRAGVHLLVLFLLLLAASHARAEPQRKVPPESAEPLDLFDIPEELRDTTFAEDLVEADRTRPRRRHAWPEEVTTEPERNDACGERSLWLAYLPKVTLLVDGRTSLRNFVASTADKANDVRALLFLTIPLDNDVCVRAPSRSTLRRRAAQQALRQRQLDADAAAATSHTQRTPP